LTGWSTVNVEHSDEGMEEPNERIVGEEDNDFAENISTMPMHLHTSPYLQQQAAWPTQGRGILAQYDTEAVIVYQAYAPAIGHFAAEHGYFGGEFKLSRMTWIKPIFLWMMYRSGWGTKTGQEVTLAIRLRRNAFDTILHQAVHSQYIPELYGSYEAWQTAVQTSQVRLQWDPDHHPSGAKQDRRAIQLGLQPRRSGPPL
jgi:Domain of unknown function (DUF4291)